MLLLFENVVYLMLECFFPNKHVFLFENVVHLSLNPKDQLQTFSYPLNLTIISHPIIEPPQPSPLRLYRPRHGGGGLRRGAGRSDLRLD